MRRWVGSCQGYAYFVHVSSCSNKGEGVIHKLAEMSFQCTMKLVSRSHTEIGKILMKNVTSWTLWRGFSPSLSRSCYSTVTPAPPHLDFNLDACMLHHLCYMHICMYVNDLWISGTIAHALTHAHTHTCTCVHLILKLVLCIHSNAVQSHIIGYLFEYRIICPVNKSARLI